MLYDLRRTFAAWRAQPMLPVTVLAVSTLISLTASRSGGWTVVLLLLLPFYGAFLGVQRVWYAGAWDGRRLSPRRLLAAGAVLLWEYNALGLVMVALGVALGSLLAFLLWSLDLSQGVIDGGLIAYVLFADVLCTFATSAIAVGERGVGDAISQSARLLRKGFPRTVPHALLAPAAVYVLADRRIAWFAAAEVAAFVARGVTTSYYVRAAAPPPVAPELEVKRNPVLFD